jgi:hypothetical protein
LPIGTFKVTVRLGISKVQPCLFSGGGTAAKDGWFFSGVTGHRWGIPLDSL